MVIAWLVAQVLQLVFESFGTPDWVMKTVLVLLATGIPFVLFFAWAFEMTPEGLKRESEVDPSQSITSQTGSKLNNVITGILVLALGYFIVDKFVLDAARDAEMIEAGKHSGLPISSKAASGRHRTAYVLPLSLSRRMTVTTCGRTPLIGNWMIFLLSRRRSPPVLPGL